MIDRSLSIIARILLVFGAFGLISIFLMSLKLWIPLKTAWWYVIFFCYMLTHVGAIYACSLAVLTTVIAFIRSRRGTPIAPSLIIAIIAMVLNGLCLVLISVVDKAFRNW